MAAAIRVLLVEDSEEDALLAVRELARHWLDLSWKRVETENDYLVQLDAVPDVILADYRLPSFSGPRALELLIERRLDIPFIVVSGAISDVQAANLIKAGASDFLLKDRLARLGYAVREALARKSARDEQRRLEAALRESEEKHRLICETTTDAVLLLDAKNRIRYANPAVRRLFGYAPEEVVGADLAVLQPERFRSQHAEAVARFVKTGVPTRGWGAVERVGLHRDGREFPVEITYSHMTLGGEPIFVGFIRDITEREKAQNALRESEAGLRQAQLMAKLAHVVTGPDGEFESWSETLPQVIGVEPARMPRSTRECLNLLHPDDRAIYRAKSIEAGIKGRRTDVEYRLPRADGTWVQIRHALEPLAGEPDALGRWRWFNTLQDVTEQKRVLEALRESEEQYRAMFEHSAVGIVHTDPDGRFLMVNPKFCEMTGYAPGETTSLGIRDVAHPEDIQASVDMRARLLAGQGAPYEREARLIRKDGSRIWAYITTSLVPEANGRAGYFISILHDVSERKQAEERIKRLNRVYAVLSGINALIVRVSTREELFREACRIAVEAGEFKAAWAGILDRETQEVRPIAHCGADLGALGAIRRSAREGLPEGRGIMGRALRERLPQVVNNALTDERLIYRKQTLESGFRSFVVLPLLVNREAVGVLWLLSDEIGFFDQEEMKLLRELAGDIAFALEHIAKSEKVDYLAYYDALTGLANRTLFLERLSQYVQSANHGPGKLALVLADLDRLKTINDSLGRQAGDALLKQFAERLANAAEKTRVARIGADEFAVILPEVKGRSEVTRIIDEMARKCFGQPFRLEDTEVRISAKSGIALSPGDGGDAESLFRNAETALGKAKQAGEPYLFYARDPTERVAERLTLEMKLRQALENEEFVLHYQPKVDLETRRIVGAEALIRWQSPELGLVPPAQFIPLMEATGMIQQAGTWALAKAAQDHSRWLALGLPALRVAVNVSPVQLRKRDFLATVREAVAQGERPPGVDLEITESIIMADIEGNIAKLKAVRDLGVRIAIDDFGTGYSSLGYLAKLPVQSLKIDRSFIISMLNDPDAMTLVQTIISLAQSLRLKVVAEGVETEEQAKLLRLLRCDEMQGYLFSRPVPFDEMAALLK